MYCFARPSHAYLGLSPGLDFETRLFYKPDAATLLEQELRRPGHRCSPIALGINTDAYQPVERELEISREILRVLEAFQHPVTIVTKSALVERDLDILARMAERNLAQVLFSITTLDSDLSRRLEPRTTAPRRRLEAMRRLTAAGVPVTAIGKINDLFAGRGISESHPTKSDDDGMAKVEAQMQQQDRGLIFANLVDFDTVYGHRNDVAGYAANLERFDARLAAVLPRLRPDDILIVTADHGNDPSTPSTDHSREYVPLLVVGARVPPGIELGTRSTFADLAQTLADGFAVPPVAHGTSFLPQL